MCRVRSCVHPRLAGLLALALAHGVGLPVPANAADVVSQPRLALGLGSLREFATSTNGQRLVSVSEAGAFVWDLTTGQHRLNLGGDGAPLDHVALSPDGRIAAVSGRDRVLRAWDTDTGALLGTFPGHQQEITGIAFHPEGSAVATSSGDGTVRVWDLASGKERVRLSVPRTWFLGLAFTSEGATLATYEADPGGALRLWDLATGAELRRLEGHQGEVRRLATLPGGRLASLGIDRTIRIWEVGSGTLIRTIATGDPDPAALVASPDGDRVLTATYDGSVRSWDPATGAPTETIPAKSRGFAGMAWGGQPDGPRLALGGTDETIEVLDWPSGARRLALDGHTGASFQGVALDASGQTVYSGAVERWTRQWNARSGLPERRFAGHPSGTAAVALSPDGTRLATTLGVPVHAVRIWSTSSGALERELTGHTDWLLAATFSPDGQQVASGSADRTVCVWDVATGERRQRLTGHAAGVQAIAFSPRGDRLASGSQDLTIRVADPATGSTWIVIDGLDAPVVALGFDPEGRELMGATGDGWVRFWDSTSGTLRRELRTPAGFLEDAAYSPDGRFLLTGEGWPVFVARLWDATTLEPLRVFAGHRAPVTAVGFAGDSATLATGSDILRVWDIADVTAGLNLSRTPRGLEIRWRRGFLERAEAAEGPWSPVAGASSPWPVEPTGLRDFFRVRLP